MSHSCRHSGRLGDLPCSVPPLQMKSRPADSLPFRAGYVPNV
jgi:hypothetical protein